MEYNQLGYKIEKVGIFRKIQKFWVDGIADKNRENILKLLDFNQGAKLLDLGCDDGVWTQRLAEKIGTKDVYGVEMSDARRKEAIARGIRVKKFNLNEKFSFEDESFDVIHSNQVIEHLSNTDNFISEMFRVLKPGGYIILSTVNLVGWHNIISLILGYQPFDLSNVSVKGNIGNPLSFWNKNSEAEGALNKSWQHIRIFTTHALFEFLRIYGFVNLSVKSSGYYILPNFFSNIDPKHGHYIAIKAYKSSDLN